MNTAAPDRSGDGRGNRKESESEFRCGLVLGGDGYLPEKYSGGILKKKAVIAIARVVVGLSGGVDSAAAAYLLKKQGYEVIGVNLSTWKAAGADSDNACETGSAAGFSHGSDGAGSAAGASDGTDGTGDAEKAAMQLGISFYNVDCCPRFSEYVTKPFVQSYLKGLTPNPCVACNRYVKWDGLVRSADEIGAEFIATGHYARIVQTESGRYTVKQADASGKDQSYMLYQLTQEHLRRTILPLSGLSKDEVRRIAAEAGLDAASKKDSQEICFVPDGDYAEYISSQAGGMLPPPGDFVDESGALLGRHKGIVNYTVGQRKGLGIALGYPAFVKRIDAGSNTVVIGDAASVLEREISINELNFMSLEDIPEGTSLRAGVKIRYRHRAAPALIERTGCDMLRISFDEPVRAPAPGQSAVLYDEEQRVIGGGIIMRTD